jgi:hypothetical protein
MLTRTVFIESVGECLALLGLTLLQRRQACGPAGIPEPGLADGWAVGAAGAMGWPGFRDAALDDEAAGAWLR